MLVFFFSVYIFGFVINDQVSIGAWTSLRVFNLIPLINKSVLWQHHAVFIAIALQCNLRLGKVILPAILLLFRSVLESLLISRALVAHACNPAFRRQKQAYLCKFKATLDYKS